jgi:hypothetical protein
MDSGDSHSNSSNSQQETATATATISFDPATPRDSHRNQKGE